MTNKLELEARVFAKRDIEAHTLPSGMTSGLHKFELHHRGRFEARRVGIAMAGYTGRVTAVHVFTDPRGIDDTVRQAIVQWDAWSSGGAFSIVTHNLLGDVGAA